MITVTSHTVQAGDGIAPRWSAGCGHSGYGTFDALNGCPECNRQKRLIKEAITEALTEYFGKDRATGQMEG